MATKKAKTPCVDPYTQQQNARKAKQEALLSQTDAEKVGVAVKTYLETQKFLHERGVYPSSY